MRKKFLGRLACGLLTAVTVIGAFSSKSIMVSNAASKTLGVPYNYVDIKTVDGNGKDLTRTSFSLKDTSGNELVKWSSGYGHAAYYAPHIFTSDEAIDTVTIPAGNYGFYSDVNPGLATDKTFTLKDHDENRNELSVTYINIDSYYNNFGYQAVSYDDFALMIDGEGNNRDRYQTASTDKQYYKVKIHLADFWPNQFNDDGTITHEVRDLGTYNVTPNKITNVTDTASVKCYFLVLSNQVANFVTPDANGDVEVYVSANESILGYTTAYRYTNCHGSNGKIGTPDVKVYNKVKDVKNSGNSTANLLSMQNVKAGTYTVTATNNATMAKETKQITVSESTNVQSFTLAFTFGEEASTEVEPSTEAETTTEAETSTETETTTEVETTTETETTTEAETTTEVETTTAEVAAEEELVTAELETEVITAEAETVQANIAETAKAGEVAADEDTISGVDTGDRAATVFYIEVAIFALACLVAAGIINQIKTKKKSDN